MPLLSRVGRRSLVTGIFVFILITTFVSWSNKSYWTTFRDRIALATESPLADEPVARLPSDYLTISEDQKICNAFYGEGYLIDIARHQHHYCEIGSLSSLQCFQAKRLPDSFTHWGADPLCIAKGVKFTPNSDNTGSNSISLHCQLRNFTAARLGSVEAAIKYKGVNNIEDFGSYFFETGAGEQLKEWDIQANERDPTCTKDANNGRWILLARREGNVNMWHKLTEIWQAMLSVHAIRIAIDPSTRKPYLSEEEAAHIEVVFEDDRNEPLDELWTIVTGNKPVRRSSLDARCQGNIILPLAGSSSPFWTFLLEHRQHETCRTRTLLDFFVRRIFEFMDIIPRREVDVHADPVVTIIDRKATRVFEDLDKFISTLRKRNPKVTFNVVDFAAISLKDQLELVHGSDVLVGHHGAGMTHVLFLPPGAAVVEIFPPPRFDVLGFRHIALMRGLTHFVGHSMWPEEWNATANGVPIPQTWVRPESDPDWQNRPKTYMAEEDFVALVEAAIRNQQFKAP